MAIEFINHSIKEGSKITYSRVHAIIKMVIESSEDYKDLYLSDYAWGHGTGLAGHEWRFSDDQEIVPGTVFTMEPLIAGISAEDTFLATDKGLESLTGKPNISLDAQQQESPVPDEDKLKAQISKLVEQISEKLEKVTADATGKNILKTDDENKIFINLNFHTTDYIFFLYLLYSQQCKDY